MIHYADDILQAVAFDSTFLGFLGTYEFEEGGSNYALSILAANQQLEGVSKITGLECVIGRVPETSSKAMIDGSCPIIEKTWRVYLIEYDGAESNAAIDAADYLIELFPGASYSVVSGGISEIAGIQQVVVKLPPNCSVPNG